MQTLSQRIQAEAAAERELSAALRHYHRTRIEKMSGTVNSAMLADAGNRVLRAEEACNVGRDYADEGCTLGGLANGYGLLTLANEVRRFGALRAYQAAGIYSIPGLDYYDPRAVLARGDDPDPARIDS